MENNHINLGIKKIKEIEFFVNEEIPFTNSDEINISFELKLNFNLKENSVEMILSVIMSNTSEKVFMRIKTSNVFIILELNSLYKAENESFNIPDNILVTMLSLSISHSRALLSKNCLGTKFSEIIIPIINPTEVLKQIFNKIKKINIETP